MFYVFIQCSQQCHTKHPKGRIHMTLRNSGMRTSLYKKWFKYPKLKVHQNKCQRPDTVYKVIIQIESKIQRTSVILNNKRLTF